MFFERHGLDDASLFQRRPFSLTYFPMHFHRAYELIVVKQGVLEMMIDHVEQRFVQGDVVLIFANQLHDIRLDQPASIDIILFSPEMIREFYKDYKGVVPISNKLDGVTQEIIDDLENIYEKKAFLYKICAMAVRQLSFKPLAYAERPKVIYNMLMYVESHYHKDINLKVIAKALGYDYAYLSKAFIQWTGITFTEYLNHYRISNATHMLENTSYQIGEIAFKCGYNNFRTFNRNFKDIVGVSPSSYMKGARVESL